MSSPQDTRHLQGLQIDDGILSEEVEGQLWVAAFMVREAILIAPDNLVPAEEVYYFNSIAHFIKASLDSTHEVAAGAKYRMPYILRACIDVFNAARAGDKKVVKSTLLETLNIKQELVARRPGLVTSPLKLKEEQSSDIFADQSAIFWMRVLKKIQSNRAAENRPPLEMAKPNAIHHRAYFWDTVYSEHHYPITFTWLCLRPSSWDPVLGVEDCRLDPRDPPPIDVPMDVDISPDAVHATVSHDQKGKGKAKEATGQPAPASDDMDIDPSTVTAVPNADKPTGNAKRPRHQGGEATVVVATGTPRSPLPPAKKQKTADLGPRQSPSSTGSSTTHANAVGLSSPDDVTVRPRRKAQRAQATQQGPNVEAPVNSRRPTVVVIEDSEDSQTSGDEESGNRGEGSKAVGEKGISVDDSEEEAVPSEHEDDQSEVEPTNEEEDGKENQARKLVRRPTIVPIESFDEARYNLPRTEIKFDPLSLILPLVWFFLHPFAKQIFEEQWAPYACLTCLRLGLPCVVNLGAFVGCYSCKKRNQACSLKPRVDDEKMNNEKLCWWIGLMHHIQSIIELGTTTGAIGTVPDYGKTNILVAPDIPDWVYSAAATFRTKMSVGEVESRWTVLVKDVIPKWRFYAMPHSVLLKLGTKRPVRPYWPDTGDNNVTVEKAIHILEQGRNGTLPRLFAINAPDGYDYHHKILRAPKQPRSKDKKKQPAGQEAVVEKNAAVEETSKKPKTRASKGKKKERTPVPSHTDPDEAPVTDVEPPPSFADDIQDESTMPRSPLPIGARHDQPMDVTHDSSSQEVRPIAVNVAPAPGASRDIATATSGHNDQTAPNTVLAASISQVQPNIQSAASVSQLIENHLPNALERLQAIEAKATSTEQEFKKEFEALTNKMEAVSLNVVEIKQQGTTQGNAHDTKLTKALTIIDALQDVVKNQQTLLNETLAKASALEAQVAALHVDFDRKIAALHEYFNGVVERIAFTDRDRDDTSGGLRGQPDHSVSGTFIVEPNDTITMHNVEVPNALMPQPSVTQVEVSSGDKQQTALAMSHDSLPGNPADSTPPAPTDEPMDMDIDADTAQVSDGTSGLAALQVGDGVSSGEHTA